MAKDMRSQCCETEIRSNSSSRNAKSDFYSKTNMAWTNALMAVYDL